MKKLFIILLAAAAGMFIYTRKQATNATLPTITPTSTPTPVSNSSKTQRLSLKKLQLEIPSNWFAQEGENLYFPIYWFSLSPTPMTNPLTSVPPYEISLDLMKTTASQYKKQIYDGWHLINTKESAVQKGTVKGTTIEGTVDPNYIYANIKAGHRTKITFFIIGNQVYTFKGDLTEREQEYDSILASFNFLDQDPADPTNSWKTFDDSKYNFTFRYPADWKVLAGGQMLSFKNATLVIENQTGPLPVDPSDTKITNDKLTLKTVRVTKGELKGVLKYVVLIPKSNNQYTTITMYPVESDASLTFARILKSITLKN